MDNKKDFCILYEKFKEGKNSYYIKERIEASLPLDKVESIRMGGFYKIETNVTLHPRKSLYLRDHMMLDIHFTYKGIEFRGCTSLDKWSKNFNICLNNGKLKCTVWMEIDDDIEEMYNVTYTKIGIYQ